MNAPFLLSEIATALRRLVEGGEASTLFLSQFPLSDADAEYLRNALGQGGIRIESVSDERTVWRESRVAGVWWGEYYTGNKVTMRTIEIARVPELAVAQEDDMRYGLAGLEERMPELAGFTAEGDSSCMKPG